MWIGTIQLSSHSIAQWFYFCRPSPWIFFRSFSSSGAYGRRSGLGSLCCRLTKHATTVELQKGAETVARTSPPLQTHLPWMNSGRDPLWDRALLYSCGCDGVQLSWSRAPPPMVNADVILRLLKAIEINHNSWVMDHVCGSHHLNRWVTVK